MCGIAGQVYRRQAAPADLNEMLRRLSHRGPDGQGIWTGSTDDWQIQLGHRRLSIIDLQGGHQPMTNEDGSIAITFNGEIYNHQNLRHALERAGHHFASKCDTESIIHQFEQDGVCAFTRLSGMFAFAIWDHRARTLTLVRDRVGIKPLYFAPTDDGGIVFASELTGLLSSLKRKITIDRTAVASLLFRDYIPPPATILRGVYKLPPGHYAQWRDGALQEPACYWRPQVGVAAASSEVLTSEKLLREVETAVHSQMLSDVPLGVFLSGGIDSSLVAAAAARQSPHIMTFSMRFEDPAFDESPFARRVAQHIGSTHIECICSEEDLLQRLDEVFDCLDEPSADPSILPTYLLCETAAKHVKVALGGDGADELWAGYPTCNAHRIASYYAHVPKIIKYGIIAPLIGKLPVRGGYQPLEWKLKRFFCRWHDQPVIRHQHWMSSATGSQVKEAVLEDAALLNESAKILAGVGDLHRVLAFDFTTYLPGSVLTKVDRASMAHGLEVRPPMLDDRLVALAFAQPIDVKIRGRCGKWLLKRAAETVLPLEVVHRPKRGFAIPLSRWIRTVLKDRIQRMLTESPLWELSLVNQQVVTRWQHEHEAGIADHSRPLWALLILDHWLRRLQALAGPIAAEPVSG